VRVNQQNAPHDFFAQGAGWKILGVVQVTGTSLTVQLTNDCDGAVIADAILLDSHQVVIVDNDGTDPISNTFAGLPEGTRFSVVATRGTQQQTQFYTISYHANDGNDVGLAYVTTGTAAQNLQITPASINEGQQATLSGHLTDPDSGDFLTLTINWGDGHTETHHPGTADFQFMHRYANNPPGQPHGAYTVHLTWFDQHGAGNSRDLFVTVNNVAPTIVLPAEVSVGPSRLLVVASYFTDPGVNDHWTATVAVSAGHPRSRVGLARRSDRNGILSHVRMRGPFLTFLSLCVISPAARAQRGSRHVPLHLAKQAPQQSAAFALETVAPRVHRPPGAGTARRPPGARHARLERRRSVRLEQLERLPQLGERGALPRPAREGRRLGGFSRRREQDH
jgi:hypothetical protein